MPKGPGKEGIRVHGHWVIDVKNLDGTVVEHRNFENALTTGAAGRTYDAPTGDQLLVALLSGTSAPSDPGIGFIQANGGASALTGLDPTSLCMVPNVMYQYLDAPTNVSNATATCYGITTTKGLLNFYEPNALGFTLASGLAVTANFSPSVNWVLSGNYTVPSGEQRRAHDR